MVLDCGVPPFRRSHFLLPAHRAGEVLDDRNLYQVVIGMRQFMKKQHRHAYDLLRKNGCVGKLNAFRFFRMHAVFNQPIFTRVKLSTRPTVLRWHRNPELNMLQMRYGSRWEMAPSSTYFRPAIDLFCWLPRTRGSSLRSRTALGKFVRFENLSRQRVILWLDSYSICKVADVRFGSVWEVGAKDIRNRTSSRMGRAIASRRCRRIYK